MQIIFATGIHGIGKTTLCSALSNLLQIPHVTASTLIKEARGLSESPEKLNSEVEENALHFKRAAQKLSPVHECVIIDGHTVLLTEAGMFHRVSRVIFEELPITCFLILYNEVGLVHSRLASTGVSALSKQSLAEFQNEELLYALSLAGGIRCDVVVAHTSEEPQGIAERLLRTRALASRLVKDKVE
jgi:adenylate kinase